MSCEHFVARFLLADEAQLEALLSDARTLVAEPSPAVVKRSLARFGRRLDRHLRLQTHALFPRLGQARALARLCRTGRRLRGRVERAASDDGRRLALATLDALDALLHRYVRQERRVLAADAATRARSLIHVVGRGVRDAGGRRA